MARKRSLVGDREVIFTETIICRFGQDIVVFPIAQDHDFKLVIRIEYREDYDNFSTRFGIETDDDTSYTIIHSRGWLNGITTAHIRRSAFAEYDTDLNLYFSFSVDVFGSEDRPGLKFSYTITQERVS